MCYVKWCLHGVHCEQEKLTPPFTQRLSSPELHLLDGVIMAPNQSPKTSQALIQPINVAHIKAIFGAVVSANGNVRC